MSQRKRNPKHNFLFLLFSPFILIWNLGTGLIRQIFRFALFLISMGIILFLISICLKIFFYILNFMKI